MLLLSLCSPQRWKSPSHCDRAKLAAVLAPTAGQGLSPRLWAAPRGSNPHPPSSPSLLSSLQALHIHWDLPGPENQHPMSAERLGPDSGAFAAPEQGLECPGTPREKNPCSSSSSPLHQLPFPFPACRCFREPPKGTAAAKSFMPALLRDQGSGTHRVPSGASSTSCSRSASFPSQARFPRNAIQPSCASNTLQGQRAPQAPQSTALGEQIKGSPVADAFGPPQGPKRITCSRPPPWRWRTLLSPYPTCHHPHTGFGVFPAPQPSQG